MLYTLKVAGRSLPRTGAEELAAGSDLSAGWKDGGVIDFVGSTKAEAFAGPVIEGVSDLMAASLSKIGEGSPLGQVLPDEAVGVFVGAPFPGVMRRGEVDRGVEGLFDDLVAVKLDSVVEGNGSHGMRLSGEEFNQASVGVLDGGAGQRADADQAALALDGGGDAGFAAAVDRVAFPVAEAAPHSDDGWAILEHAFARKATAAVVSAVALAPPLRGATQVGPKDATALFVLPDPEVDGLVAHDGPAESAKSSDDLFWAPVPLQQPNDQCEVTRIVAAIAPRAAAATIGHLDRRVRSVRSVVRGSITLQLPRNGAAMSAENPRDPQRRVASLPQRRDMISFFCAQLSINHRQDMSHLLPESKKPNKAPDPTPSSHLPAKAQLS
jgi:hypothetical protein